MTDPFETPPATPTRRSPPGVRRPPRNNGNAVRPTPRRTSPNNNQWRRFINELIRTPPTPASTKSNRTTFTNIKKQINNNNK